MPIVFLIGAALKITFVMSAGKPGGVSGGIMVHITEEQVRAGLAPEEDFSLLHEVNMKTESIRHLGRY